jgi:hypothetical protein
VAAASLYVTVAYRRFLWKKYQNIFLAYCAVLVLLTGSFAGGFITRHALAQTGIFPGFSDSPHPEIVLPPTSAPVTPVTPSDDQTSATPGELQTLFAPSGRRGTSSMNSM